MTLPCEYILLSDGVATEEANELSENAPKDRRL